MEYGRRSFTKTYSEPMLEGLEEDSSEIHKKSSCLSITGAETSERVFAMLRDILQDTLSKPDHELEELAFMNLKIAEVITKSDALSKLRRVNELKAVLFEIIILIKEQCIGTDKTDSLQNMELKMRYNSLRASYSELKNTLSSAKMLVNEGSLLLGQIIYQNSDALSGNRSKKARVDNLHRQFDMIKAKLNGLDSETHSLSRQNSEDTVKDSTIERLQDSLETRKLQIDSLKNDLTIYRQKCDKAVYELQEEKESSTHEIQMLRNRLTQLRQTVATKTKPLESQQDMLIFLLMQSLSLEQLMQP